MSSPRDRSTPAVPALEHARTNYEPAIAYDPATAGWPGLHLGRLLYLSGDLHAAAEAFRASIASGHVAYAPVASYHLGRLHEDLRCEPCNDRVKSSGTTVRYGRSVARPYDPRRPDP